MIRFRDLRIGAKQTLGFALVLVIMAGANIYSINKMGDLNAAVHEISASWLPRALAVSDVHTNTANLRRGQLQLILAQNDSVVQAQKDVMINLVALIDQNLFVYDSLKIQSEERGLYSGEEATAFEKFDESWEDYQNVVLEFLTAFDRGESATARAILSDQTQASFDALAAALVKLVEANRSDAIAASASAQTTFENTRTLFRIVFFLTLALSAFIAIVLVRLITVPLKKLVSAVQRVAAGDLGAQLDVSSGDEVGRLAKSFNKMTIALGEARKSERRQAELRAEADKLRIEAREAEAKMLKAENERKTRELEEARQLQLSMLPDEIPQLPGLEIAAFMETATEVGGDYYDFKIEEDGVLTVAIGDATGHGTKAGVIVTAVKSLFEILHARPDMPQTFREMSHALKAMNLGGKMFMAMSMLKIKDGALRIVAAGMPFALILRAASQKVEQIELRATPLGGFANFPYKQAEARLQQNDLLVLMSDGLPERFNPAGEIPDYPAITELVEQAGQKTAEGMIDYLVKFGEEWADGRPQDDDVTFVVLRKK